ncbi:PAS domain-containing sensor histidine kinase [Natronoarchaeum mannanilyticum]|uniref:PAS domain-containing sensor histidine kinase n=1 Tax=Natronoarchaeum mannanilyticum TaxID=926360 RepID=UPI00360A1F29
MTEDRTLDDVLDRVVGAASGATYRRRRDGDQPLDADSEGMRELLGVDPESLDGNDRGWLDVVHPDDRGDVRDAVADLAPGERVDATYRVRHDGGDHLRREGGEYRWVRDRGTVPEDAPDALEGVLFDVTDERTEIADLEDDSQLLDGIFESIPVHLFVKDTDGVHLRVSDQREMGESLVGKTDLEVEGKHEDAKRSAYEDDLRVIETGEPILDQEEYLSEFDQWNLTSKVPRTDDDGEVVGLIGVARDITERKRAEQELEQKTERLAEFADVVSHDIKNPLTVADGRLELAAATGDPEHVEEVVEALDRADAIVDDVLALSRRSDVELDREPVSLRAISRGAGHSVSAPRADISLPPDVEIVADRSQLRRLLENLFKNAVQHGRPDVSIDVVVTDDGFAVEDDGPGIPPEERERVFETAYTTHEDGTGFGLSIVREVADAHGWSVSVCEGSAGGARFEITGVERADAADQKPDADADDRHPDEPGA